MTLKTIVAGLLVVSTFALASVMKPENISVVSPISEKRRVCFDADATLTQEMMPLDSGQNTIYVIRNLLKLEKSVIIPANCVLLFDGGSIVGNGKIVGQSTYITGLLLNVIGVNISINGEWNFQNISPDWFIGSDVEKVQKAFDVSIANRSAQIIIDRTYNLTGGTVYVDRGSHSEDELSKWSRRSLIISGNGEGRLIKEDAGFMFSARSLSIDYEFDRLHFRGYIKNPSDINTVVDMRVFDCRYLGNIRVKNCSFCHCGSVYYQTGGVNTPMQGNLSIGNQYVKNKCVMKANECWNSQFIGDLVEHGLSFVEGEKSNSNIRDLKIVNCCIEGFNHEKTAALNLNCNTLGLSICDNYFEANYCSIRMPRYVSGTVTGNAFHSRGASIKKDIELHCIELARLTGVEITANNVVVDDDNMCLFYFDITSPYYVESQVLVGSNSVEGKTKLTNVEKKVKDLNTVLKLFDESYIDNITNKLKKDYPQIGEGNVIVSISRGITTISIGNLVVNRPIERGAYHGHSKEVKPYNPSLPISGAIVDKDNNRMGIVFVTNDGDIGLRVNQPGIYNGIITYPHL